MKATMNNASKIKRQLEHLLAQDLSEMGFQAQVRHRRQIEELRALASDVGTALPRSQEPSLNAPETQNS